MNFFKLVWMMILEEWRNHSRNYNGASFALFPFMIFGFTAVFSYFTLNFSVLGPEVLGSGLILLMALFGLAAGTVGFYGRDALRNVLGEKNYLIYSSRTLPIKRGKLVSAFLIKDVVYYGFLLVLPASLGFTVFSNQVVGALSTALIAFLSATILSLGLTHLMSRNFYFLDMELPLDSLTNKTLVDVSRSSGGLLKLLFSLGILTFFYWYFVLYFPIANSFLNNPLLSFSVILGFTNLSVYNWINRFDSYEEYKFLPISFSKLVDSKKKAYLVLTLPLTAVIILMAYAFYPGNILLALLVGFTSTMHSLVVAEKITKLRPNLELYHTGTFLKVLFWESLVILPLLIASILYDGVWTEIVFFSFFVLAVSALVEEHWSQR
jgi:hypothetical protein